MKFNIQCNRAYYPKFNDIQYRDDNNHLDYWRGTYINELGAVEFDIYPALDVPSIIMLTAHILKNHSYSTRIEYTGLIPTRHELKLMCNSYLKAVHKYLNF